ncbi:hypothetical protein ACWE42_18250 [Sutcliffiella cohnii]|uniref:Glycosyl transferase family 2 n=1 Tax=Sutcliffiella cohnii TaxID=33932 RepID=A0A223KSQ7_9BACI|nr:MULTISPECIES: hypothetical protein [Sutcliffiella]AST92388.1 hypothetical protein BC6307_14350 [Sutcliffiella cohnii]MED4017146.1 hypothetical protein [Sutcliffiella cohnii]WBL13620.1 hypothetical protein O1A01_17075 [Sutcliffiella sp. NC1]
MNKVALLAITHDPSGKNIRLFKESYEHLKHIYSELFITVSDQTSNELIQQLNNSCFQVKIIPKLGAAHARREVVSFGLTGESTYFHYCDFDRLLTWSLYNLPELKDTVNGIQKNGYFIYGRTEYALNTHPTEWIETEKITNKIFSLEIGMEADVTAGSCSFSRACATYIQKYSKAKMTDAEWPLIISRIAKLPVNYKAVDGLQYVEEINAITKKTSESERWLGRLKLSLFISETAITTGKDEEM